MSGVDSNMSDYSLFKSAGDLLAMQPREIRRPEQAQKFAEIMRIFEKRGESVRSEIEQYRNPGRSFWLNNRVIRALNLTEFLGLLGLIAYMGYSQQKADASSVDRVLGWIALAVTVVVIIAQKGKEEVADKRVEYSERTVKRQVTELKHLMEFLSFTQSMQMFNQAPDASEKDFAACIKRRELLALKAPGTNYNDVIPVTSTLVPQLGTNLPPEHPLNDSIRNLLEIVSNKDQGDDILGGPENDGLRRSNSKESLLESTDSDMTMAAGGGSMRNKRRTSTLSEQDQEVLREQFSKNWSKVDEALARLGLKFFPVISIDGKEIGRNAFGQQALPVSPIRNITFSVTDASVAAEEKEQTDPGDSKQQEIVEIV